VKEYLQNLHYSHWMIVAGTLLVVLGFISFAFRQNQETVGPFDEPTED
jgi:uncharacterized membrane protein